jgi:hypothetical protein
MGNTVMRDALRAALAAGLMLAGAAVAEPVALRVGTPLEVEAGDAHRAEYRLDADAARTWLVVIEEVGIDLVVARGGPEQGNQPIQFGRQRLAFPPDAPRGFTVRVVSRGEHGAYRLRVEALAAREPVMAAHRVQERAAIASGARRSPPGPRPPPPGSAPASRANRPKPSTQPV